MKPFKETIQKRALIAVMFVVLVSLNHAQHTKTDSAMNLKTQTLATSYKKAAPSGIVKKKKPVANYRCRKNSPGVTRCFEDGFAFKQNPLSDI